MKTLLETLQSGTAYLEKRGVDEPRLNMEHLTAKVLGCTRMDLYLSFDRPLEESQLVPLRDMTKRRGDREPLQHILGNVEFMGKEFLSDKRALIPRPETEELVGILLDKYKNKKGPSTICDVGCGSGVIGISLAIHWPESKVEMIDLSDQALELTEENIQSLDIDSSRFNLIKNNLLEGLGKRFDLIVANLPYVGTRDIESLEPELKYDPVTALDGGESGLFLIEESIEQAKSNLNDGGVLALEIGDGQTSEVVQFMNENGYKNIESLKDLSHIERFVIATL
ncbi:MAG: protein-(glutamine-N5) methyltransferase, release factor-specific [Verrucomicrobiales bacterium]|nr:protein-(glutamine-N5) methyltransferase, release factor-specific [Verrucomicrobiales bacterium]|tara:strand:+ start:154 stop:999 length:846 start_codon:yes stop_codon:yes gene_type:complete